MLDRRKGRRRCDAEDDFGGLSFHTIDFRCSIPSNGYVGRSLAPTNVVLRIRKDSLAMVLVLIALVSLTTVYRARPLGTNEHHVAKIRTEPTQQRNLQTTNFESASPVAYFMPLPSPHYVRQPSNADRTFTPRRLPGSYYNRPPPSVLS